MDYKYSDITEKIIKACMIAHSTLGKGFQEVIYQRAIAIEFNLIELNYQREFCMPNGKDYLIKSISHCINFNRLK